MPDTTHPPVVDLVALRSSARRVISADTLARYEHLLQEVNDQRYAVSTLISAITIRLDGDLDPVTKSTVTEAHNVGDMRVGTGLQSADDLCRKLARTVLELCDAYELT